VWPVPNPHINPPFGCLAPPIELAPIELGSSPTLAFSLESNTGGVTRTGLNSCPGGTVGPCGGEGGISSAELGWWRSPLPAGLLIANLESHDATAANGLTDNIPPAASFISPGRPGSAPNCTNILRLAALPGGASPAEAVGLGGQDDSWALDSGVDVANPSLQFENITMRGSGYPACGFTFDTVYTNMHDQVGAVTSSGSGLPAISNDQVRTLYSYFTYVLSPLGQSQLPAQTLDQLPASWLATIRQGFEQNF
jgi:hypothetical protein